MIKTTIKSTGLLLLALSTMAFSGSFKEDAVLNDNPPVPRVIIIPKPANIIGLRVNDETGIITAVSDRGDPAGFPYIMGRINFETEVINPETGEVLCRIGDYFHNPE